MNSEASLFATTSKEYKPNMTTSSPLLSQTAAGPLVLLVAADDTYAIPLAVTLFSALEHLTPGCWVRIYIFDGGTDSASRARVERVIHNPKVSLTLGWITPDVQELQSLPLGSGEVACLSQATYSCLFAAEFIPEAKAIDLDSDLLIQPNIEASWKLDLTPYAAVAVPERTTATLGQALAQMDSQEYYLESTAPYYNAGILLLNLDWWRAENIAEAAFAVIREHREVIGYLDQDGLNVVLQSKWLTLDRRWNFQTDNVTLQSEPLALEDIFILHYSTRFKPWLKLEFGLERLHFNRYLTVLALCGWLSTTELATFYLLLGLGAASKSVHLAAYLVARRSR